MPLTGSCLCGKVKVTVQDAGLPLKPVICRCTFTGFEPSDRCRDFYGAVIVRRPLDRHVQITGETKAFEDHGADSGNVLYRRFCPDCGAPIQSVSPSRAGTAIIKMGVFARTQGWGKDIQGPSAQIFTRNKKDWEPLVEGISAVDGAPQ
ncbi:CENP-V/GFA domain-containing protein [Pseudozyma hubeiensis]|nr:CENP-V/GFA domain-containing protein [Pseudozyma hubeiensis]